MPAPATSGQHGAEGQKAPDPLHPGCRGPLCLADRQTGTASRTGSGPRPPPCQIVLNYNDKRWQASTATSQNMTNTPHAEPTSAASRTSVPSRRLSAGYLRPRARPTWPAHAGPRGRIRVGASGRGLGPHRQRRQGPEPPHSPGVPPPHLLIPAKQESSSPPAAGKGCRYSQPPSLWSSFQNHRSSPATHRGARSPPRGACENPGARGGRVGTAQAMESQETRLVQRG